MKYALSCSAFVLVAVSALPVCVFADQANPAKGAPVFTSNGELNPPTDYYNWVFLTSDLGMSYNEDGSDSKQPPFSNVFVDPAAYRAFLKTGIWPNHTQFVKEFRASNTQGSINHHGFYQTGKTMAVLVHVKDTSRFKGGWGFFAFDGDSSKPAKQIPTNASCYSCHEAHGAVESTFVQFYPSILPVAIQHATLSKGYLADEAAAKKENN